VTVLAGVLVTVLAGVLATVLAAVLDAAPYDLDYYDAKLARTHFTYEHPPMSIPL
jgi:hypothetical protein